MSDGYDLYFTFLRDTYLETFRIYLNWKTQREMNLKKINFYINECDFFSIKYFIILKVNTNENIFSSWTRFFELKRIFLKKKLKKKNSQGCFCSNNICILNDIVFWWWMHRIFQISTKFLLQKIKEKKNEKDIEKSIEKQTKKNLF